MSSTLILNSDANPISMLPLSTIPWEDAIRYMVTDKATVLEWHDGWIVNSTRWSTPVPSVMILKEYQKPKHTMRFSKGNIFLRDGYRCQYCGIDVLRKTATLDHVLPVSHGGKTTWENCTTACGDCNSNKGNNHKIKPKIKPYKPGYFQLVERRKKLGIELRYTSWANYLNY